MICKYCNGEIEQGQLECPYCGRDVEPQPIYAQPIQPTPRPTRPSADPELQSATTAAFVFALIGLMIPVMRIAFIILAFVFYRKSDKLIKARGITAPPLHRTTMILMIIALVFMVFEIAITVAVLDPAVRLSSSRHTYTYSYY